MSASREDEEEDEDIEQIVVKAVKNDEREGEKEELFTKDTSASCKLMATMQLLARPRLCCTHVCRIVIRLRHLPRTYSIL